MGTTKTMRILLAAMLACLLACAVGWSSFAWAGQGGGSSAAEALTLGIQAEGDATVSAGGFSLSYRVAGGEATITGIKSAPSAQQDLTIPSAAGSAPVTAIGPEAFKGVSTIGKVTLPSTLKIMGESAFMNSSVTSVEFPASIAYIPYRCFRGCASLGSATFAPDASPEYIGTQAFYGCTALEEFAVPPLTGNSYEWICEDPTASFSGGGSWRIGLQAFANCSSLAKVSFLAGNPKGIKEYLKDGGQQFGGNAENMVILNYCKNTSSRYGSAATWYFAVNFYQSKADAEADVTHARPWKQMLCKNDTNLLKILTGKASEASYEGSDALPALPAEAQAAGKVWGVNDHLQTSSRARLSQSCDVYPVDKADLDYGWVTSPEIDLSAAYNMAASPSSVNSFDPYPLDNFTYVRLRSDGTADLSGMAAYAADGSRLDASQYNLVYEKGTVVPQQNRSFNTYEWSQLASAASVNAAGVYRVHAVGVGAFSNTSTPTGDDEIPRFTVKAYTANVANYTGASADETANQAAFRGVSLGGEAPLFTVVAPRSSWQKSLVAASLSGVGGGQAVLTNGSSTSAYAYRTLTARGTKRVIFIGSTSDLTSAVVDTVKSQVGEGGSFDTFSQSAPDALAVEVFNTVRKYGPLQEAPYDWGTTAIVMSQTRSFGVLPITQFAYQAKAPIFFTSSTGSISASTLAALAGGGFTRIVIAGDASFVSDAVASKITSSTGIAPTRMLNGSTNAYAASVACSNAVISSFADAGGSAVNAGNKVVVASASDPANVIAGAQLAAAIGGRLLSVASSADMKAAEAFLVNEYADLTAVVYLVGDFSGIDAKAVARMESVWGSPLSTSVGAKDTVEAGGILYTLGSGSAATATKALDAGLTSATLSTVKGGSKTFTVTAIGASAFKSLTALKTLTVKSKKLKTIGASAFYGCKKLSTMTFKSTKLKKVGSKAFKGVKAKATVKAPKSKLSAYKKLFKKAGLSSKAKWKKA